MEKKKMVVDGCNGIWRRGEPDYMKPIDLADLDIDEHGQPDYMKPIDLADLDIDEEGEPDHTKPMDLADLDLGMDRLEMDMRDIAGELRRENKEMFFYAYGAACACKKIAASSDGTTKNKVLGCDIQELVDMVNEIKDQNALFFINGALQACVTIARDLAEQRRQDRRERLKLVRPERG